MQSKRPHLTLAHQWWTQHLTPGDRVVDATVGNGHDFLFLASLLQGKGALIGYDIQILAIKATAAKLATLSEAERSIITLKQTSHALLSEEGLDLVVYNLGYLPGGDKSITTQVETTLTSLKLAYDRLNRGGALSITCYPGHSEGEIEQKAVIDWLDRLPQVTHHFWRPASPSWHRIIK